MSARDVQVLGIDFGTANSYFCKYLAEPEGHKIRTIDFGSNQLGGISSTILYREGKTALVGNVAEQEWGEALPAERRGYTIRTHFKTEIVVSPDAARDATNFLKTIAEQMRRKRVDFAPEKHQVIFGIPGEADEAYKNTLLKIAADAGYGEIRLIYEPIGALLYHLWNKDISPAESQRGILVVDFGGGTCDFAFMQRLEVYRAWGDMQLGGRLFDDLFFQWFLEQNPSALKKLLKEGNEYYVHWFECRRVKEFFSETMALDRGEIVRYKLGQIKEYGAFQRLTWEAFEQRARNYTPHDTFRQYLRERQLHSGWLLEKHSIDLFEWFRSALVEGLEKHRIHSADIERVILTGGSSQWPFVKDIVCEALHISEERLLSSENPKAAISEGLVILPSLQTRFERVSTKLRSELSLFFKNHMEPEIERRISTAISQILQEITARLFDGQISPILHEYREQGGSIQTLKDKIKAATYRFEPHLKDIIQKKLLQLNEALPVLLHEMVSRWFERNGITYYGDRVGPGRISETALGTASSEGPDAASQLYEEIMNVIGGFVIVITAAIAASLAGGGGTALIMSGPLGIIIGGLITILLGYLTLEVGKEEARETVEKIEFPSTVLKMVLWEARIKSILQDGREKLENQLHSEIEKAVETPLKDIRGKILQNINREIDNLSLLNQL